MKILIVAISSSIHTSRWISQLKDEGFEVFLFPSTYDLAIHDAILWAKPCVPFFKIHSWIGKHIFKTEDRYYYQGVHQILGKINANYQLKRLHKYIHKIKPDIIHSLETQAAGYLVAGVKNTYFKNKNFPKWWHSNWGSDIYLFGRIPAHQDKIKQVLANCDYYSCECFRDIELAIKNGYKGKLLPVYPNAGGFDINNIKHIKEQSAKPSQRRIILLKGYQNWAGRALVGFRALERCADILKGFEIYVHSNTRAKDIQIAASLFTHSTNIPVTLVPEGTPHQQILELQSKARISIGLSVSDGISTSLLEAMAMGAFPIQSCTACADEWFEDRISGFIVPPEDPEIIEQAIRKAIADNELVDKAAELNYLTIVNKADSKILQQKTKKIYQDILNRAYEK